MMFLFLNLLQPQQGRISRVVIVGAVVVFIAGVSLLVYFYRKYRHIEKEPEEDWDLSRRSLFVNVAPPTHKTEEAALATQGEVSAPAPQEVSVEAAGTRQLASEAELPPAAAREPVVEPTAVRSLSLEDRPTQVLSSASPKQTTAKPSERGATPFDDEVWAGLETSEKPPIIREQVQMRAEPTPSAPVVEQPRREPYERPRIERILHREPYETPRIEPLTPREQAATRELDSTARISRDASRATMMFGAPRSREARDLATEPAQTPPVPINEPAIARSHAGSARKALAGSVLGLPAEVSQGPLILGEPVRPASEEGIAALSHYGEELDQKGGRVGTIILLVVVAILGGALALYLFVPTVHSGVRGFVEHVRGVDTQRAIQDSMTPKAVVYPSFRPEVSKNIVKARGAVDNISDQPLENLSIEVSLQRGGDAPPETRTVQVTPNPLPPNQRGMFEFEYDGKRDTGFAGYKITKLFSNDKEIKFRAPNQK